MNNNKNFFLFIRMQACNVLKNKTKNEQIKKLKKLDLSIIATNVLFMTKRYVSYDNR